MEKLIEKVNNLKSLLDESDEVIRIRELNKKLDDEEFLRLIDEFKVTKNMEVKNKILSNEEFVEYKELENKINLLILKINQELKKISSKGKCFR